MGREVTLDALMARPGPLLALAPMQDVTDLPFWRLLTRYGGADLYFTEYFRVYPGSVLNKHILRSITQNPTGRPVIAQMIGHDIAALVRTARELQQYPIAGVDLNLGCPAPVVFRKRAGGGLLREPARVEAILGALRETVTTRLSVKTRIGFDSPAVFAQLLPMFARHRLDLLTVHGRTVREGYTSGVHYDSIARAVREVPCPVLANGNICSSQKAQEVLDWTGARGLMIGRAAIRNPWIFEQIRQQQRGEAPILPTGRDVLNYVYELHAAACDPHLAESSQVQRMKKYMNYLALGVEPSGRFLHGIRRVVTRADFFRLCEEFLNHDDPLPLHPFRLNLRAGDLLAGEHG